jgi:hypothetical protein
MGGSDKSSRLHGTDEPGNLARSYKYSPKGDSWKWGQGKDEISALVEKKKWETDIYYQLYAGVATHTGTLTTPGKEGITFLQYWTVLKSASSQLAEPGFKSRPTWLKACVFLFLTESLRNQTQDTANSNGKHSNGSHE